MSQSLGEPSSPGSSGGSVRLGQLLLERGLITPVQLREALAAQVRLSGPHTFPARELSAILIEKGYLTGKEIESVLADLAKDSAGSSARGSEPSSAGPARAPERSQFGRYQLVREAGRGAMSIVYEAVDLQLERRVALKMVHAPTSGGAPGTAQEEERFVREARLTANLPKHPHVVGVYDAGVIDGRRYIAMEYVEGRSFEDWRKQVSRDVQESVGLLRDVALAVHHAHEHGVIHRDLKPANILVDAKGAPHVTDFGLAKAVGQNLKASYSDAGLVVGTPGYMSPEQAQGLKSLDRRTDVYALGVILYEILTGRVPFSGDTAVEVMLKTVKDPVVAPSKITSVQINPVRFKQLEAICLKALAKSPGERYSTAFELAEDLNRWASGGVVRVDRPVSRRVRVGVSVGGAALLVALGVAFLRPHPRSVEPELARADLLFSEQKFEEALRLYREAGLVDRDNPRALAGEARAQAKLREKPAPAPPLPPPPEDPWSRAVDLLPRVDLEKDVVSGKWADKEGVLWNYEGRPSRLQFPYRPPGEYDVRVEFLRRGSNYCMDLILTRSGHPFALVLDRNGVFGFEKILAKDFHANGSSLRTGTALEDNKPYTLLVEVRASGVSSTLQGEPICRWRTDYSDLTMNPQWELPDPTSLGIGAWEGTLILRRIQVREVSGPGEPTRPAGVPPRK
ncbi:MAG TPA: protein kinase [Planctomycetota bacterium]|nr:protein kinase [Planctomycetota bacterium]